jgi:hypothetical protein
MRLNNLRAFGILIVTGLAAAASLNGQVRSDAAGRIARRLGLFRSLLRQLSRPLG